MAAERRIRLVNADIIEKLPSALNPITDEQGANAAIALLLKPEGVDFEILIVKRAKYQTDVWSGQMALPEGKPEKK